MTTATSRHHAIIVGGGIGGPVAAMALQRAGIEATIYEAYDRPADFVGSFLNLSSNGIDALRAIGADRPVLDVAFPTPRMVMWSGRGKRLGEVANGIALDDGTPSQTVQRGLLHRALREEALRRGITIIQGKRLVGVERFVTTLPDVVLPDVGLPDGGLPDRGLSSTSPKGGSARSRPGTTDAVLAIFEDGSTATGTILIGADGLHSRVRRAVDASAPMPRDTGLLSIGGHAYSHTLPPTPETFHMIFGTRAFFGYTVRPSGEVYWFANVTAADAPMRADSSSISPSAWKAKLRELFAMDEGPALEIIDSTGDEIAAYPIFDMPAVPTWHAGPMIIIGDAAHATSPSSGQGASLAIEDAVVLAKCLRDTTSLAQAFATYEQLRRTRVQRVVAYSARIGKTKTPGPIGRWFRDLLMPFALRHFASPKAQAWLYRHHIDWHEDVTPVVM